MKERTENPLRLAEKIGYGSHALRTRQGERVDFQDVIAYETRDHHRTIAAVFVAVVCEAMFAVLSVGLYVPASCRGPQPVVCVCNVQALNFVVAALDLALIFGFGGQREDWNGVIEPTGSSSLLFTLFVGILSMPGVFGHVIFGSCLLADASVLLNKHREALATVR
jgi:hypothetical protein